MGAGPAGRVVSECTEPGQTQVTAPFRRAHSTLYMYMYNNFMSLPVEGRKIISQKSCTVFRPVWY